MGIFVLFTDSLHSIENRPMSAYTEKRNPQIFSLPTASKPNPTTHLFEELPALPKIAQELSHFFAIAKQIEVLLLEERTKLRELQEQVRETLLKNSKITLESDNLSKEATLREEQLKLQITAYQQAEKSLKNHIEGLHRQINCLREEKKKSELQIELLGASLQQSQNKEKNSENHIGILSLREKSYQDRIHDLQTHCETLKKELDQYKAAWRRISEIDQKAKEVFTQFHQAQSKNKDLSENIEIEKKRRDHLEEVLKKEKKEKEVALTCLHSSESRLSKITQELETLRQNFTQLQSLMDQNSLEISF